MMSHAECLSHWLKTFLQQGIIRQIDMQTAKFIAAQEENAPQQLAWLTALLSRELGRGHICLNLSPQHRQVLTFGINLTEVSDLQQAIEVTDWNDVLKSSRVVGRPGDNLPLIFDGERLYFHRYWFYEIRLAEHITSFGTPTSFKPAEIQKLAELLNHLFVRDYRQLFDSVNSARNEDEVLLRQRMVCESCDVVNPDAIDWSGVDQILLSAAKASELAALDQLIPEACCLNWQKVAAAVALTRRFTVISGGPGTGKTTTVARLLAALVTQQREQNQTNPIIRLVAPTGKAAARLTESIGRAIGQLPVSTEVKECLPTHAGTLHRLLGSIPNSVSFHHNAGNPLHLDILVVDEASMVDLPMMYKLFDALPEQARIILLGDKDQLASVEAGAVLGDICSFVEQGYSREQAALLSGLTGFELSAHSHQPTVPVIADSLCMLQKSYRFSIRSGIGQLARVVNQGRPDEVEQILHKGYADIQFTELSGEGYSELLKLLVEEYRAYLEPAHQLSEEQAIKPVLDAYNRCRLLCAVREGEFGVAGLNQRIERALIKHKLIRPGDEVWYVGRPVMITRNDYNLGLYNGDIGICLADPASKERRLKVYFELPDGRIKGILPSRLPEHEVAYAMTVHKSQGSEFEHTFMILPPDFSPVLTRELVYTGITRAKKKLYFYANNKILRRSVGVKTERLSGLAARLT